VLHERVVFLTIVNEDVPYVQPGRRLTIEVLDADLFRVLARYGFAETPDINVLLESCAAEGLPFRMAQTTFFLSRETLVFTDRPGLAGWRKRLFARMQRNALRATAYFGLPPNRVVELGTQIEFCAADYRSRTGPVTTPGSSNPFSVTTAALTLLRAASSRRRLSQPAQLTLHGGIDDVSPSTDGRGGGCAPAGGMLRCERSAVTADAPACSGGKRGGGTGEPDDRAGEQLCTGSFAARRGRADAVEPAGELDVVSAAVRAGGRHGQGHGAGGGYVGDHRDE
jgi:hypothetical protein